MDFTSRRTDSRDSGRAAWGARQRWARVRRAAVHSTGQSPARRSGVKSEGMGAVGWGWWGVVGVVEVVGVVGVGGGGKYVVDE